MFDKIIRNVQNLIYTILGFETRLIRDDDDPNSFLYVLQDLDIYQNEKKLDLIYDLIDENGLTAVAGVSYMPMAFREDSIVDSNDFFLNTHSETSSTYTDYILNMDETDFDFLPILEVDTNIPNNWAA